MSELETHDVETPTAPAPGQPIELSDKAVQMIKITREQEKLDPASHLRVAVRGGGCSGFEYSLDFDLEPRETDFQLAYDGLTVLIDPVSARYLDGTVIDYVLGPSGSGFKFNNPRASGTCGCGSSFSM